MYGRVFTKTLAISLAVALLSIGMTASGFAADGAGTSPGGAEQIEQAELTHLYYAEAVRADNGEPFSLYLSFYVEMSEEELLETAKSDLLATAKEMDVPLEPNAAITASEVTDPDLLELARNAKPMTTEKSVWKQGYEEYRRQAQELEQQVNELQFENGALKRQVEELQKKLEEAKA